MGRLDGKDALVTGAGNGIGKSIALLFGREGARVAVADRDRASAEQTLLEIERQGGRGLACVVDVSKADSVGKLLLDVERRFKALHILVNNAGIARRSLFQDMREEDWDAVMATNLKGVVLCTQKALHLLKRQPGGKVINIASVEAFRHTRKMSAYAASKGALASLSQTLALELAQHKIHVNYICPGLIRTRMTERYLARWLFRRYMEYATPLGRVGEPEDVAKVALFLASTDSDFITGQGITVDGGLTLKLF
jgi:NAD(P)-dependent dehydrogenase (short-subunit alcohol dehydrogenase family)